MTLKTLTGLLLGTSMLGSAGIASAQDATITIESWRNDDLSIWQEKIMQARPATSSPAARSTPRSSSSTRVISPR